MVRRARAVDWVARARALAPLIEAAAPRIEADRQLPPDVLAALHEAGMYRMLLPRWLGGAELEPAIYVQAIEAIAQADASTAWCLGQGSGCSMSAAYLSPEIAREVFGPADAALAWGQPPGRAEVVAGGYRASGTWMFASGGRHATWLGGHCLIIEADGSPRRDADGQPIERTMLFPRASVPLIDVWDVIGLRGTGSDTYSVTDRFVPEAYTLGRDQDGDRRETGTLYRFSTTNIYAAGFAAVALGIARASLDAFIALAREKASMGSGQTLRDNEVIQSAVAQAEARFGAARAYLLQSLADIHADVAISGRMTLDQRMRIRLASTYAIHEAKSVVDTAYQEAGATAIFARNPFERRFRDMHAVSQQQQGRRAHFETVGQHMLGLRANTRNV